MFRTLLMKELALQRQNFGMIAGLSAVWLLGYAFGFFKITDGPFIDPAFVCLFVHASCVGMLVLLVPLMVGTTIAVYERKDGILDWQLSLPVSRAKQWAVKLLVSLAITGFCAGVVAFAFSQIILHSDHLKIVLGKEIRSDFAILTIRGMWVGVFSMLIMSAGVFASVSGVEPYRALFFGMLLFLLPLCAPLIINDYGLLSPGRMETSELRVGLPWLHAARWVLLGVVLCAFGYANFRAHGVSMLRTVGQLLIFSAVVIASGYSVLHYEFAPARNFSNSQLSAASAGVIPVLYNIRGGLYQKPGNPNTYLAAVQARKSLPNSYRFGRIVEVDLGSGRTSTKGILLGRIEGYNRDATAVQVMSANGKMYDVGTFPLPIRTNSFLYEMLPWNGKAPARPVPVAPLRKLSTNIEINRVFGRPLSLVTFPTTSASHLLYAAYTRSAAEPFTRRVLADWPEQLDEPRILDMSTTSKYLLHYAASPDQEWFADLTPSTSTLRICKTDLSTTYVLPAKRDLILIPPNLEFGFSPSIWVENLHHPRPRSLPVSPDGTTMLFCRFSYADTTAPVLGLTTYNYTPRQVQVAALDLANGKEYDIGLIKAQRRGWGNQSATPIPLEHVIWDAGHMIYAKWLSNERIAVSFDNRLLIFAIKTVNEITATCTHDAPIFQYGPEKQTVLGAVASQISPLDHDTLLLHGSLGGPGSGMLTKVSLSQFPRLEQRSPAGH